MNYRLVLPPDLDLSPAEFVEAWNSTDEARAVAGAHLLSPDSVSYDPFLIGVVAILATIGVGVSTNAIYDLIKYVLGKMGKRQHIKFVHLKQPDGTELIVIEKEV